MFDSRLYYQEGVYRTTSLMDVFHYTLLKMKEMKLLELVINKKTGLKVRPCGGDRIRTGVQTYPPKAFYMFIPALIVGK